MGVRREATGTGPDVKPAPQRNGFPGESKVSHSGDWISEELGDHRVMVSTNSDTTVTACTETQTSGRRVDTEVNVQPCEGVSGFIES